MSRGPHRVGHSVAESYVWRIPKKLSTMALSQPFPGRLVLQTIASRANNARYSWADRSGPTDLLMAQHAPPCSHASTIPHLGPLVPPARGRPCRVGPPCFLTLFD